MKVLVLAHEGDSYTGSYTSWQDALGYDFRHTQQNEPIFPDDQSVEEFWNKLYQEQFEKQVHIDVDPGMTVREVTKELAHKFRKPLPPRPHKQTFEIQGKMYSFIFDTGKGEFNNCHLVHIPSGRILDPTSTLLYEGIEEGDILGLMSVYPANYAAFMIPVPSSEDLFAMIKSNNEYPPQNLNRHHAFSSVLDQSGQVTPTDRLTQIWGALLYTDEDESLSIYVRKYFASLSRMSGSKLRIFVIEQADQNVKPIIKYWKEVLQDKFFLMWSTMGWLSSKPYDKSYAYEVASKLGVYPDQLPCLVLFDELERKDKLIFPIHSVSANFFRNLFSALERSIATENDPNVSFESVQKKYTAILNMLMRSVPVETVSDRTHYTFFGQTVFINRPQEEVMLSDFQKIDIQEGTMTDVQGDQINISGTSGGVIAIKSTMGDVIQNVGSIPNTDQVTKDELKQLLERLSTILEKAPAGNAREAETVAKTAKRLVDDAADKQPDKTLVQISAEGLKKAAENLAKVLPDVLPIAIQIAATIMKVVGVV